MAYLCRKCPGRCFCCHATSCDVNFGYALQSKNYAGTDFTFQVSVMATVSGGLYSFSGVIADALGYFHYLIAIVSIAVLFLIPIYLWKDAKTI